MTKSSRSMSNLCDEIVTTSLSFFPFFTTCHFQSYVIIEIIRKCKRNDLIAYWLHYCPHLKTVMPTDYKTAWFIMTVNLSRWISAEVHGINYSLNCKEMSCKNMTWKGFIFSLRHYIFVLLLFSYFTTWLFYTFRRLKQHLYLWIKCFIGWYDSLIRVFFLSPLNSSPFYGEDFYCEIPRSFRHLSFYIFDRDVFRRDSSIG